MKLYELTEQFLALQELVYDPEVDEQTFQDTMEGLWGEIEDKAREFDTFPNEKQRISRMNAYIFLSNLLFLCIGFFRLFVL